MRNYWFGNSYRVGALLVASIDLANALIHAATGLVVIFFPQLFTYSSVNSSFLFPVNFLPDAKSFSESLIMAFIAIGSVFVAECALVSLLFCGILQRDPVKCDIWSKIRLVLLALGTFGYVFEVTLMTFQSYWQVSSIILILVLAVTYRAYSIVIVRSFRADLLFVLNGYDLGLRLYPGHNKNYANAI